MCLDHSKRKMLEFLVRCIAWQGGSIQSVWIRRLKRNRPLFIGCEILDASHRYWRYPASIDATSPMWLQASTSLDGACCSHKSYASTLHCAGSTKRCPPRRCWRQYRSSRESALPFYSRKADWFSRRRPNPPPWKPTGRAVFSRRASVQMATAPPRWSTCGGVALIVAPPPFPSASTVAPVGRSQDDV